MLDDELETQLKALVDAHGLDADAADDLRRWMRKTLDERTLVDRDTSLCRTQAGPAPEPPQLPVERYELLDNLGGGGMGEVWSVRDRALERRLAMKVLRPDRTSTRARFVAEAQVTSQLDHPAIVPVYELGQLPDGRFFFTMREVRGETLSSLIRRVHDVSDRAWGRTHDGWDLEALLAVFAEVCAAVGYAHERGVVHRDLKPSNLMVGAFGEVQVLDWGIAKVIGEAPEPVVTDWAREEHATQHGEVFGTPAYMSPEQAYGWNDRVDARSDVYGLGAVLYELLAGRPPYRARDGESVLQQVLAGPPPPLADQLAPKSSDALIRICERAMSRERAGRFADASELELAVTPLSRARTSP